MLIQGLDRLFIDWDISFWWSADDIVYLYWSQSVTYPGLWVTLSVLELHVSKSPCNLMFLLPLCPCIRTNYSTSHRSWYLVLQRKCCVRSGSNGWLPVWLRRSVVDYMFPPKPVVDCTFFRYENSVNIGGSFGRIQIFQMAKNSWFLCFHCTRSSRVVRWNCVRCINWLYRLWEAIVEISSKWNLDRSWLCWFWGGGVKFGYWR